MRGGKGEVGDITRPICDEAPRSWPCNGFRTEIRSPVSASGPASWSQLQRETSPPASVRVRAWSEPRLPVLIVAAQAAVRGVLLGCGEAQPLSRLLS